ncbi:hypothetical protein R1sor_000947 [Riccia sorocarpa]|uniref:Uncharacterized protein n=1 Tax=Riccia sorocarpa TaxID=122646 RepID=A0ABD3GXR8_9MARC
MISGGRGRGAGNRGRGRKTVTQEKDDVVPHCSPLRSITTSPDGSVSGNSGGSSHDPSGIAREEPLSYIPRPQRNLENEVDTEDIDRQVPMDDYRVEQDRAQKVLEYRQHFPFGDEMVIIPVRQMVTAPSDWVVRPLIKSHTDMILKNMKENPTVPLAADVVLVRIMDRNKVKEKRKLHLNNIDDVKAHTRNGGFFAVISGAHSTKAMRELQETVNGDKNHPLWTRAQQLKTRQCRIISGKASSETLRKLSVIANSQNKLFLYESSFIDTILHGRNIYRRFGYPKRPVRGGPPAPKFEKYKKALEDIFDTSNVREIIWICTAAEEVWKKWVEMCNAWMNGSLPDGYDVKTGQQHESKGLVKNTFRSFCGLTEDQLLNVMDETLKGNLLYGETGSKTKYMSMEELEAKYKINRAERAKMSKWVCVKKGTTVQPWQESMFTNRCQMNFHFLGTFNHSYLSVVFPKEWLGLQRYRLRLVFADFARSHTDYKCADYLIKGIVDNILTFMGEENSQILFVFAIFPGEDVFTCRSTLKAYSSEFKVDIMWGSLQTLRPEKRKWFISSNPTLLYALFSHSVHGRRSGWETFIPQFSGLMEDPFSFDWVIDEVTDLDLAYPKVMAPLKETKEEKESRM